MLMTTQFPRYDHRLAGARGHHVHTVVRTPNGNDYGMDLLRQRVVLAGHHQIA